MFILRAHMQMFIDVILDFELHLLDLLQSHVNIRLPSLAWQLTDFLFLFALLLLVLGHVPL